MVGWPDSTPVSRDEPASHSLANCPTAFRSITGFYAHWGCLLGGGGRCVPHEVLPQRNDRNKGRLLLCTDRLGRTACGTRAPSTTPGPRLRSAVCLGITALAICCGSSASCCKARRHARSDVTAHPAVHTALRVSDVRLFSVGELCPGTAPS